MTQFSDDYLYSLKNVGKTYNADRKPALWIDRLQIPKNKIVVILGNSGSGKTTLLNLLGLLDRPDPPAPPRIQAPPPEIFCSALNGVKNIAAVRSGLTSLRRGTFGFIFQEGYLLGNLSNRINAQVPLFINGLKIDDAYVARLCECFGIEKDMLERVPAGLSGGEQQRLSVVRSMIHNPKIILADEPTSNIGHAMGMNVMKSLKEWRKSGEDRSLIWVTHNVEQSAEYSDYLIFLRDGKVIECRENPRDPDVIYKILLNVKDEDASCKWTENGVRGQCADQSRNLDNVSDFGIDQNVDDYTGPKDIPTTKGPQGEDGVYGVRQEAHKTVAKWLKLYGAYNKRQDEDRPLGATQEQEDDHHELRDGDRTTEETPEHGNGHPEPQADDGTKEKATEHGNGPPELRDGDGATEGATVHGYRLPEPLEDDGTTEEAPELGQGHPELQEDDGTAEEAPEHGRGQPEPQDDDGTAEEAPEQGHRRPEPREDEGTTEDETPMRPSRNSLPFVNMASFIFLFALSDIFPKCAGPRKRWPFQKLFGRRNSQALNMATLFIMLLFSLFFLNISFSLENYFRVSISDPRINSITVSGKINSSAALDLSDMDRLSTLVWAKKQGLLSETIVSKEIMEKEDMVYIEDATLGAFGSKDWGHDYYLAEKLQLSMLSGRKTTSLDTVVMNVNDPILTKYFVLEGDILKEMKTSETSIRDLYLQNYKLAQDKPGVVMTREALTKELGYSRVPETVEVDFMSKKERFPVLGVVEALPFWGKVLIAEGWQNALYMKRGSVTDPIPGYQRITVYISDMIKDGLPLCNAILSSGYKTSEDFKSRLEWIKNLTDFVLLFSVIAGISVLLIGCGALFASYAQAVEKKKREIGVLMANGIKRTHLHFIFFSELVVSVSISLAFAVGGYHVLNRLLKWYMTKKLALDARFSEIFALPGDVWWILTTVTLLMTGLSVIIAVHLIVKDKPADILKKTN